MSAILMVFFSQSGTTARVAESIAFGLRASGHRVDLCNIKHGYPKSIAGYDMIGIGSPAYYFRPSMNITDYVNSLPSLNEMPNFVFVLYGTYPGDTGNAIREALRMKGAREVGYFKCRGADLYQGYLKAGYLFSPDNPLKDELSQAEEFASEISGIMAGQTYTRPEPDPPPTIIYRLERFFTNRWLIKTIYSRLFHLDKQKCTACSVCMMQCPTNNISANNEGQPVWSRNCLLCLSCEMNCPQEAITSPASWPLFKPVFMYNVTRASRDSSLDYVRVKHTKGRTTRV